MTDEAPSAAGRIVAGRDAMREALRRSSSALKEADVPFALAGSYALWVFGGPESAHDVDLVVPETEADGAAEALASRGFVVERPVEDWLFKAAADGVVVDVLHALANEPVSAELLDRAELYDVLGVWIPVLPPTEVLQSMLHSMTEHHCDFGALLPAARAVRESVDWARLRTTSADHPYADAFLYLLGRLGISE